MSFANRAGVCEAVPGGATGGGLGGGGNPLPPAPEEEGSRGMQVPGAVSAYKALARKLSSCKVPARSGRTLGGQQTQDWTLTAPVIESQVTLTNLDRGVEYDFEVVATNPTGDSLPSKVVTVVL